MDVAWRMIVYHPCASRPTTNYIYVHEIVSRGAVQRTRAITKTCWRLHLRGHGCTPSIKRIREKWRWELCERASGSKRKDNTNDNITDSHTHTLKRLKKKQYKTKWNDCCRRPDSKPLLSAPYVCRWSESARSCSCAPLARPTAHSAVHTCSEFICAIKCD